MKEQPIVFDKLLVLFGGAGLATKGLVESECAKHIVSIEIDPAKHHLSKILNPTVEHIEADVLALDSDWIASFDAVWASPPCQEYSEQKQTEINPDNAQLLYWTLQLTNDVIWIENVLSYRHGNSWGTRYNAAQFEQIPRQLRRRMIGGNYRTPYTYRKYKPNYPEYTSIACPAVMASELGHGGLNKNRYKERRKAMRWYISMYQRMITIEDMAYLQGIDIPCEWYQLASKTKLSQAIGNGVPTYMSRAFGDAYSKPDVGIRQLPLFDLADVK